MRLRHWHGPARHRLLAAVTLSLLVAVGVAGWVLTRPAAATPTGSTVAATTGTMSQTVTATGTVEPAQEADLSFTAGGLVTSVSARVGASVRKGAVLATVDGSALQAQVNAAAAGVTAASALVASEASAPTATAAASAQAQLAWAQAKLVQARAALAATTLSSPIAGTVAAVTIAPGDVVAGSNGSTNGTSASGVSSGANGHGAGSPPGAATAQIVVISPAAFLVTADVGGVDLPQVAVGMQAKVTTTGSTHPLTGVVRSVGILADSASGASATFPVVIGLNGSPTDLYAGGSADVSIIVKQTSGVLTVPTQALHTAGSSTVVLQMVNGKQLSTPVTVGATYGPRTQILSGLQAGDLVVVPSSGSAGAGHAGRARSGKGSANRRNGNGNGGGGNGGGGKATRGRG